MRKAQDTGETLKVEDYPIGTRVKMDGGDQRSIWKVDAHILDDEGEIVKVKLVRENPTLKNMFIVIFAGSLDYSPMIGALADDVPIFDDDDDDDEPQKAPVKPERPVKTESPIRSEKAAGSPVESVGAPRRKVLNTSEIAKRTGKTPKDILFAISNKKLEAEKQGRTYVATIKAVDAWAKANRAEIREQTRSNRTKAEKKSEKPVKAVKNITSEKDVDFSARGKHLKVPIREDILGSFKADDRNPFPVGGFLYGSFQAFIDGDGEASYDDILMSCLKMKSDGETEISIRKNLDNHISAWKTDKTGPRGLHIRVERTDGTGRISKGEKGKSRYRFVGFKEGSSHAEKAKAMGW